MKKRHFILAPLLSLAVFGLLIWYLAPAGAVVTQRQDADGGASWVNSGAGTAVPLGEHHLVITLSDINTASTAFVAVPFAGKIKEILFLQNGAISTASANVNVYIAAGSTGAHAARVSTGHNQFGQVSPDNMIVVGLLIGDNVTGNVYIGTPTLGLSQRATNSVVERGDIIAINTDGGSTLSGSNSSATITIVIH